ncbi:hypothetical protein ACFQ7A_01810 [Streptomyces sp. NPDC056528]|uniref:hypothetical protein n=1 Tax=Streptomyces sp. NPDC056528 TaxID=3345854 RepID=UPI0036845587
MTDPRHALPGTERTARIRARSLRLRLASVRAVRSARWGFLGSCLSVADLLAALVEHLDLAAPGGAETPDHDRLVLSKGHAAPALYAAVAGWEGDGTYAALDSPYQGHPNLRFLPGAGMTTGSLGLGVPAAAGLARGLALRGGGGRVAVVTGDGELQTGIALEGYQWALRAGLRNLLLVVDANGHQSGGPTRGADAARRMLASTAPAFAAVDGHDLAELDAGIERLLNASAGPAVLWASTVRGSGVPVVEQKPVPMSWIPDDETLDRAEHALGSELRAAESALAAFSGRPRADRIVPGRTP